LYTIIPLRELRIYVRSLNKENFILNTRKATSDSTDKLERGGGLPVQLFNQIYSVVSQWSTQIHRLNARTYSYLFTSYISFKAAC